MAKVIERGTHWTLRYNDGDSSAPCERIQCALLQDIRDELVALRNIFQCRNAQEIPMILRAIRRNTTRRKRVRKVVIERG